MKVLELFHSVASCVSCEIDIENEDEIKKITH